MEDIVYYALVGSNNKVIKCFPCQDDTEFERIRRTIPSDWVDGTWKRVTNDSKIPTRGWNFVPEKNAFCEPRPYVSWKLNDNLEWIAPSPCPTSGRWYWDEETLSWKEFTDDFNINN